MDRLVFVGPGRLGLALGQVLSLAEVELALVYCGRHADPPAHPLFIEGRARYRQGLEAPRTPGTVVVLAVQDALLPEVTVALAEMGSPPAGCVALHCSGALDSEVLEPLHDRGYSIGTLHPLEAVASPIADADRFQDSFFAVSGEPEALHLARVLTTLVGATPITVPPGGRPLYHAAAVMVSNYLVTLLDVGMTLFQRAGASEEDATAALASLAKGTLRNLEELGPAGALTGPIARGDIDTVGLHLRAIERDEARLYAALGLRTLELAEGRIDPEVAGEIEALFARYA